jgi:hypothetical protein
VSYDVFISYSHAGDDLLSERVQDGLSRFAKLWWRRRALNVFRDRSALSAKPGLVELLPIARLSRGGCIILGCPRGRDGAPGAAPTACWCC